VSSSLLARRQDNILLLELSSESGYARLTHTVLEDLHRRLDAVRQAAGLQAVVISGTDRAFAVGADIQELSALNSVEARNFSALGQGVMRKIERLPVPVVAAVRGYCLGGGFDLALACHARVASTDAIFAHPGSSLGVLTGWGGTARLPRLVGRARALDMFATGRSLTAAEAYDWGLVRRLATPAKVLEAAVDLALNLRQCG
jgi:enoyl-CoA hydratase